MSDLIWGLVSVAVAIFAGYCVGHSHGYDSGWLEGHASGWRKCLSDLHTAAPRSSPKEAAANDL